MSYAVTASFDSAKQARRAIHNLLDDHFPRDHIRARGPGFSPRPPRTEEELETGRWGGGMGAGIGGMWGGLIGLINFALPAESGVVRPLASLLGGALIGALTGGAFGRVLGVRAPKRRAEGIPDSRPIVIAVETDSQEQAERAEADLLNVLGLFRPKLLEGPGTSPGPHGLH